MGKKKYNFSPYIAYNSEKEDCTEKFVKYNDFGSTFNLEITKMRVFAALQRCASLNAHLVVIF